MGMKKNHGNEFKAKVVLAALKEDRSLTELASEYGVHPIQIGVWKKQVKESVSHLFEKGSNARGYEKEQKQLIEKLYEKIGQVEVENDWLKKKLGF